MEQWIWSMLSKDWEYLSEHKVMSIEKVKSNLSVSISHWDC